MLFAGNRDMSILFGPSKWGSFFEAFFVSLWYRLHFRRTFCLASEPFCCDLAQVKAWGIFKPPLPLTTILHDHSIGVSSAFAVDTVRNVSLQHFPYIVYGTSVHTDHFIVKPLLAFKLSFGVIDAPFEKACARSNLVAARCTIRNQTRTLATICLIRNVFKEGSGGNSWIALRRRFPEIPGNGQA